MGYDIQKEKTNLMLNKSQNRRSNNIFECKSPKYKYIKI